jgi:putative ABC transport system permease protein
VGTLVGVLGVSSTVQASILARLTTLGDVLTIVGTGQPGGTSLVPGNVLPSVRRIPTVQAVAATRSLTATVRRTALIPTDQSGGIVVAAFDGDIVSATDAEMVAEVRSLSSSSRLPEAIVGWEAAQSLGVNPQMLPMVLWVADKMVLAVSIMGPTPVESAVNRSVFVPTAYAREWLGFDGLFDTVYVRAPLSVSGEVSGLLLPTVEPSGGLGLMVTQNSSALIAHAEAATAFENLFVALAAIGLLVAGISISNILTIAVLERRTEIGIRRALGATRASIAILFVAEGLLISFLGGVAGVILGVWITLIAAWRQGIPPEIPLAAPSIGLAVALIVALAASLYPAFRAAVLPPSEALRTMR